MAPPHVPDPLIWAIRDNNGSLLSLVGANPGYTDWATSKPEATDKELFKQLWALVAVQNSNPQTYLLRSLASGNVLTVAENVNYGGNINGKALYGSQEGQPAPWSNQLWTFEKLANGKFVTKNYAKGTALEPYISGTSQWVGASNVTYSEPQSWDYEYRSRTSGEIEAMLKSDDKVKNGEAFKHYTADGTYVNLPATVRQEIWEKSMLGFVNGVPRTYPWRNQIFDCDDFAIVMKAEVAKWAADNLKSNHFALVMGICWGDRYIAENDEHAVHAFNWYLTPDSRGITWYEPQTGVQHDDAMGYKIYYGNF